MFSLLMILSKQSNDCDSNETLEEGLICCNNSICNEYCYDDVCIKSNKIWFCCQEGALFLFIIKFVPSIVFTLSGVIIRLFHKKPTFLIFGMSFLEFYFNTGLFFIIIGIYCFKIELWATFAIIGALFVIGLVIGLCVILSYLDLPLYKFEQTFTNHTIYIYTKVIYH